VFLCGLSSLAKKAMFLGWLVCLPVHSITEKIQMDLMNSLEGRAVDSKLLGLLGNQAVPLLNS